MSTKIASYEFVLIHPSTQGGRTVATHRSAAELVLGLMDSPWIDQDDLDRIARRCGEGIFTAAASEPAAAPAAPPAVAKGSTAPGFYVVGLSPEASFVAYFDGLKWDSPQGCVVVIRSGPHAFRAAAEEAMAAAAGKDKPTTPTQAEGAGVPPLLRDLKPGLYAVRYERTANQCRDGWAVVAAHEGGRIEGLEKIAGRPAYVDGPHNDPASALRVIYAHALATPDPLPFKYFKAAREARLLPGFYVTLWCNRGSVVLYWDGAQWPGLGEKHTSGLTAAVGPFSRRVDAVRAQGDVLLAHSAPNNLVAEPAPEPETAKPPTSQPIVPIPGNWYVVAIKYQHNANPRIEVDLFSTEGRWVIHGWVLDHHQGSIQCLAGPFATPARALRAVRAGDVKLTDVRASLGGDKHASSQAHPGL